MKEIPLTSRPGIPSVALIDDEDYALVSKYKWSAGGRKHKNGEWYYAYTCQRRDGKPNLLMHRLVMNAPKGVQVDHINGNRLDNRKSNLRFCTQAQNNLNRSKHETENNYKGVFPSGRHGFRALICLNYKYHCIGSYPTEEEAAIAYDEAAIKLHGEFARTNFPPEYRKILSSICKSYASAKITLLGFTNPGGGLAFHKHEAP